MKFEIDLPMTAKGFTIIFPLKYLLALLVAFIAFAVVATPAEAIHPFRQRVVVQRQVIRQPIVRQRVVVQKVVQQQAYVQPFVQQAYVQPVVQAVYAQPVVVQQVQAYSQNVCYPQAQIVAPVVHGGGSACFFSR